MTKYKGGRYRFSRLTKFGNGCERNSTENYLSSGTKINSVYTDTRGKTKTGKTQYSWKRSGFYNFNKNKRKV